MLARGEAAPSPMPGRNPFGGREFGLRVFSGIVLAVIVVSALILGGWPFALIWLAAGIVGAAEWIGMSRITPAKPVAGITAATLAALVLCAEGGAPPAVALALLGLGCSVSWFWRRAGAGGCAPCAGSSARW